MKIAFLGDIAFLGQFDKTQSGDVERRVCWLKDKLAGYDCVIANLESPLTARKRSLVCKSMHLKAAPCNVELLKYLNVTAVSLANNHIADFGLRGLRDTIKTLESAGIEWFGVGNKCFEMQCEDNSLCFSGFCCYSANGTHYEGKEGIHLCTYEHLEEQLERDEEKGMLSVVSLHWGMEHTNYPAYEHIKLMNTLLSSHSAIVAGHHPHIVQGVSKIGSSMVAYSLGNAIFDRCISINKKLVVKLNEDNRKGFIWGVTVENNQIIKEERVGFYIGQNGIETYDMEEKLNEISTAISNISNREEYERLRQEQFQKVIAAKFGKHNLKWLLSRLNYYAIGARVLGTLRSKKYKKEMDKFING